jgi:hypothetical protein
MAKGCKDEATQELPRQDESGVVTHDLRLCEEHASQPEGTTLILDD